VFSPPVETPRFLEGMQKLPASRGRTAKGAVSGGEAQEFSIRQDVTGIPALARLAENSKAPRCEAKGERRLKGSDF